MATKKAAKKKTPADVRVMATLNRLGRNALAKHVGAAIELRWNGGGYWIARVYCRLGDVINRLQGEGLCAAFTGAHTMDSLNELIMHYGEQPIAQGIGKTPLAAITALEPMKWRERT